MSTDKSTTLIIDALKLSMKEKLKEATTDIEANEILEKFDNIDLNNFIAESYNKISERNMNTMKNTMHEAVMRFRADSQEFLARQDQKWCNAFVASEAMYLMILESAELYVEYVNELEDNEIKPKQYTFTAMLHIHGRALQEFLEIIVLMKNGLADGAYARWRSMYELFIISSFITENGEKVAKAYIDSYEADDNYEWARSSGKFSTKKKYITFNDIQRTTKINTHNWKEEYKLANKIIHPSSQGTFARLSNFGEEDIIPVGRSDYGITTPAEHSAISISQITIIFYSIFPYGDGLIAMQNINEWVDVVREEYFKAHDEIFENEDKLWKD